MSGALICIEMDSNAKLGADIIPGDPKSKSETKMKTDFFANCFRFGTG